MKPGWFTLPAPYFAISISPIAGEETRYYF